MVAIFARHLILDIWQGSSVSGNNKTHSALHNLYHNFYTVEFYDVLAVEIIQILLKRSSISSWKGKANVMEKMRQTLLKKKICSSQLVICLNITALLLLSRYFIHFNQVFIQLPVSFYLFKVINESTRTMRKNLFKVNNKDTRTTSMMSFWCLKC